MLGWNWSFCKTYAYVFFLSPRAKLVPKKGTFLNLKSVVNTTMQPNSSLLLCYSSSWARKSTCGSKASWTYQRGISRRKVEFSAVTTAPRLFRAPLNIMLSHSIQTFQRTVFTSCCLRIPIWATLDTQTQFDDTVDKYSGNGMLHEINDFLALEDPCLLPQEDEELRQIPILKHSFHHLIYWLVSSFKTLLFLSKERVSIFLQSLDHTLRFFKKKVQLCKLH